MKAEAKNTQRRMNLLFNSDREILISKICISIRPENTLLLWSI